MSLCNFWSRDNWPMIAPRKLPAVRVTVSVGGKFPRGQLSENRNFYKQKEFYKLKEDLTLKLRACEQQEVHFIFDIFAFVLKICNIEMNYLKSRYFDMVMIKSTKVARKKTMIISHQNNVIVTRYLSNISQWYCKTFLKR